MRALVIVACALLVGCGRGENCFPGGQALQCESEGGTATIVPPAGYVTTTFVPPDGYVTTTLLGVGSRTCLAIDGTCWIARQSTRQPTSTTRTATSAS